MTINERLHSYLIEEWIECADDRWQGVLEDLLAGRIGLYQEPYKRRARIVLFSRRPTYG